MSTIWALRKNTVPQKFDVCSIIRFTVYPFKSNPVWGSQFLSWGPNFGVLPPQISPEAVPQELRRLPARHLAKPSTSHAERNRFQRQHWPPNTPHLLAQRQWLQHCDCHIHLCPRQKTVTCSSKNQDMSSKPCNSTCCKQRHDIISSPPSSNILDISQTDSNMHLPVKYTHTYVYIYNIIYVYNIDPGKPAAEVSQT